MDKRRVMGTLVARVGIIFEHQYRIVVTIIILSHKTLYINPDVFEMMIYMSSNNASDDPSTTCSHTSLCY